MRNRAGFTITEILVAIGLVGVAILGTFNVLSYFKLQYNRSFLKTDASLSTTLGERFLYTQFKNAYPSFNNLVGPDVLDDNGKNFYDLVSDYPVNLMPAEDRSRELTLEPGRREVTYVIVGSAQEGPVLYIDPVKLFNVSPTANGMISGALDYVGFTNNGYIQSLAAKEQKSGSRSLWRDGNIFYLYLPLNIRIPDLADPSKDSQPVSPYCFFGAVSGGDLTPQNFFNLVNCKNPIDGQPITDVKSFMLNMPSQQGGIPIVLMRSVSILKYELKSLRQNEYDLLFSKWDQGTFGQPQTAATNVIQVRLKRNSIADTVISVSVKPKEVK